MITAEPIALPLPKPVRSPQLRRWLRRNPTLSGGLLLCSLMLILAAGAPYWGMIDPVEFNPVERLRAPSTTHWFGTDMLGRDLYSRTLYGSRISLSVGAVSPP